MRLYRYPPGALFALQSSQCQPVVIERREAVTHVLIDEKDGDIFAVMSEAIEGLFDGRVVGFGVYDKEILLCVRR